MSNIGLSAPRRGVVGVLALDPSPRFVGVPGREGSGGGFNFAVVVRDRASDERADLYFFVGFGAVARDCLFSSETPREDIGHLGGNGTECAVLPDKEEDILISLSLSSATWYDPRKHRCVHGLSLLNADWHPRAHRQ